MTALAFAEGGRLLVSAGGDTLVAVWQLLDVLDAPASPAPPAPLFSWCGSLSLKQRRCVWHAYHRPCISWARQMAFCASVF